MKAPSPSPQYILFYNFLVTNPSFMKFGDFSYNLSRINILDFFFQNSNWFLRYQHFFKTRCYFLCISSVGIMNISLTKLVVFKSGRFRKNLSKNTFPISMVIINLGNYIWGAKYDLFMKTRCLKSVQIRSFFWSVFSYIQSKYRKMRTRKYSVFGYFSLSDIILMTVFKYDGVIKKSRDFGYYFSIFLNFKSGLNRSRIYYAGGAGVAQKSPSWLGLNIFIQLYFSKSSDRLS